MDTVPTLSEWAGGLPAFETLTEAFYAKVPRHPVLAPVFAGMNPAHATHVAAFIAEVFGGPTTYTEDGGSHAGMIAHYFNRHLTEDQRRAWVSLMLETADEVGLLDDPEFRAAFCRLYRVGNAARPDQFPAERRGTGCRCSHACLELGPARRTMAGVNSRLSPRGSHRAKAFVCS